ncbi:MAG: alpha/beta hydrolase, partial [Clostridia bacterium]|nr:alpha/beta hydrolase [Clostridia bacterium]
MSYLHHIFMKERENFNRLTEEHLQKHPLPKDVTCVPDIPYLKDGNPVHCLDVYRCYPRFDDLKLPAIINIHGGGMIMGNKEFNRCFCGYLSRMGYVVFSLEYRLVPEVTVFEQLQDIADAMKFLEKIMSEYHADPEQVYLVGDSAGAFLALYTAAIQRNPMLAKASGVRPSYLEIQSMALISGMFYTTKKDSIGLFLPKALYGKNYKKHSFYPYLDPSVPAVGLSLPPCLLITSKMDRLYSYTRDLSQALQRCGTPCTLKNYGDDP